MQRPRRTTEFHEEPGTASKSRQSARKAQQRSIAPSPVPVTGTARKYSTRQSRIAVPTTSRASSSDRATGASLVPPSSVTHGVRGNTPQRTPQPDPNPPRRVLFTAEKQKVGGGGGGGHNDKKWVQEQTQRISQYLSNVIDTSGNGIAGIRQDFFKSNCGGLRQMSIKQFIAIINYFLRFITRLTVNNNNYVEDIVSIMQKLNYPHQLNKSWLKTPNTQHSFGNVIVLLDFLMDFVPPELSSSSCCDFDFPLQEPQELTSAMSANRTTEEQLQLQIPDTEFQAQILLNSEAGFALWDKQLMDDFIQLQQQSCDLLIQKTSGFADLAALDTELAQLSPALAELERNRPSIPKDVEEKYRRLKEMLKEITKQMQMSRDYFDFDAQQLEQLLAKSRKYAEEIARLESDVNQTQALISTQMCSVDQRNALIEDVAQLAHVLESQKRTVHDLQQRNYQQQVLLSRVKKQLTDQVENFNAHMHGIIYSEMYTDNAQDLQLPVQPTLEDLQRVQATLTTLRERNQTQHKANAKELQKLEQQIAKMQHKINISTEPKSKALSTTLTAAQNRMQDAEVAIKKEREMLDTQLQQLDEQTQQLHAQETQLEQIIRERQEEIARLEQENEQIMSNAEQEYNAYADAREAHLDRCEKALAEVETGIEQLAVLTERNEVHIAELRQKLEEQPQD